MKWLTAAFASLLILMVILADRAQLPAIFVQVRNFPGGDKVGHFLLFGTMALLLNLSLRARRQRVGPIAVLPGSLIIAMLVTIEEFSQKLFASRNFSLTDLLADFIGIYCFGRFAEFLVRRKLERHRPAMIDRHAVGHSPFVAESRLLD